jgi:hypothetical protein
MRADMITMKNMMSPENSTVTSSHTQMPMMSSMDMSDPMSMSMRDMGAMLE